MILGKQKSDMPAIYVPLTMALLATLLILFTNLDVKVSNLFFNRETGRWLMQSSLLAKAVYALSPIPAIAVFSGGVIILLGSIWRKSWCRWRRAALYWALVLALGPGLVVNAIFKDFYGRPRPSQVVEYGGAMSFHQVWAPGEPGKGKSFPCGHASVGFYFMAGYFYWWRKNPSKARRWLLIGVAAGLAVGFIRVARGAHWFSDVLWSGFFVYFVSYVTAWGCGFMRAPGDDEQGTVQHGRC